jgi:GT2 family glycosyltransferase
MSKDIWLLIPVHNRRETTRRCLLNLETLEVPEKYTVCVIDDGCSDGTSEMLARDFGWVRVLAGDGNLYWGGGIARGMRECGERGAEVVVWLNDDCLPDAGAIETIVARARATRGICGGVCRDSEDPALITYSGMKAGRAGLVAPGPGNFETIDGMNGNLVAIHGDVVGKLGPLDARRFPHYGGDEAYCIAARRAGIPVEIAGSATAVNPRGRPFEAFGRTKPASAIFREPFRLSSCLYWPTHFNILRLAYGWRAYFRWPAYFLRLIRLWRSARRVEKQVDGKH